MSWWSHYFLSELVQYYKIQRPFPSSAQGSITLDIVLLRNDSTTMSHFIFTNLLQVTSNLNRFFWQMRSNIRITNSLRKQLKQVLLMPRCFHQRKQNLSRDFIVKKSGIKAPTRSKDLCKILSVRVVQIHSHPVLKVLRDAYFCMTVLTDFNFANPLLKWTPCVIALIKMQCMLLRNWTKISHSARKLVMNVWILCPDHVKRCSAPDLFRHIEKKATRALISLC